MLDYDSLIVACGAQTSYFGNDAWKDVSFGLKTLRDAVELRDHIAAALEQAEHATDPGSREEWLTFVVVGGDSTGVEISGQLAIIAHTMKRDFSRIDSSKAKVILVDAGKRVVPVFSEKLSAKAADGLAWLGVTVREGLEATAIDERGLTVKAGETEERIAARTVIWAAGVRAVGLTEIVARATGATTDRGGQIEVNDQDCTVPGHPEISAIGDMASHKGPDGKPLPGLATVAIQQARHAAKAIRHGQPGPSTPFRYRDKGALAVIGRGKAVPGQKASALGTARLCDVPRRPPLLPQRGGGQAAGAYWDAWFRGPVWEPAELAHRGWSFPQASGVAPGTEASGLQ